MNNIDCKAIFEKYDIKYTKQRNLIFNILNKSTLPMSVENIYLQSKTNGYNINLSTIYRIIDAFVKKNIIVLEGFEGKKTLYALNRHEHKHLLICLKCKQKIVLEQCPLDAYEQSISKSTDFEITDHQLSLYGYCSHCKEQ